MEEWVCECRKGMYLIGVACGVGDCVREGFVWCREGRRREKGQCCLAGYNEDGSDDCKVCDCSCLDCYGMRSNCTKCGSLANRTLVSNLTMS